MTHAAESAEPKAIRPGRRKGRLKGIAAVLLLLFALYTGLGFALAWNTLRPKRRPLLQTPDKMEFAYKRIAFASRDGTKLSGWYLPVRQRRPRGVILLCHGVDGNRQAMLPQARILRRAGFAIVMFDFRARGESGGAICTMGYREVEDLQAAIAWTQPRSELHGVPVGVLGASMGGAVALMATARTPAVRAVIAEAPFARLDHAVAQHFRNLFGGFGPVFGLPTQWAGELAIRTSAANVSPVRDIGKIAPRPVLIIADGADTLVPAAETDALMAQAGPSKTLWTVPGAGHVDAAETAPEEYARRITQFFRKHLANSK